MESADSCMPFSSFQTLIEIIPNCSTHRDYPRQLLPPRELGCHVHFEQRVTTHSRIAHEQFRLTAPHTIVTQLWTLDHLARRCPIRTTPITHPNRGRPKGLIYGALKTFSRTLSVMAVVIFPIAMEDISPPQVQQCPALTHLRCHRQHLLRGTKVRPVQAYPRHGARATLRDLHLSQPPPLHPHPDTVAFRIVRAQLECHRARESSPHFRFYI